MMLSCSRCAAILFFFCGGTFCAEPAAPAAPVVPGVTEQDLERAVRAPLARFSWSDKAAARKAAATNQPRAGDPEPGALPDLSGGDIIVKSEGPFTRELQQRSGDNGQGPPRSVLTLNKNVIIEQLQQHSVIRAQKVRVIENPATGKAENFQAEGGVELYSPDLKGRGEKLNYEMHDADANGNGAREVFTIEAAPGAKATLWQGTDVMEAERFVRDAHLDTFRAIGHPAAVITLPAGETPPAQGKKAGGMMPGLAMTNSGKVRIQAEGELFFDKAAGRVRIARNVQIQQQAMVMNADEAILVLGSDGSQPADYSGVFSGSLKSMECNGRVEIKTPDQTVLCDHGMLDMKKNTFLMSMTNPAETVKIYNKEQGKIFIAPKSIKLYMDSGEFEAAGPMRTESFTGAPPSIRKQ